MTHHLARVVPAAIYGAPVWLCTCGHRAWTLAGHHQHTARSTDA